MLTLDVCMTALLATASATPAPRLSSAEILRDVKKLSVLGTALYVAAHPDDENTRLLATLSNQTQVRTAYLALTRGEGGQNLIGQELGPLLGMIRTQELLAARRVDGAEQYFTRARDFGFSKSVDETLAKWDHDAVLADAVYVVRSLRPDVIIARFSLQAGETHGHHTASARLALEAFKAAADPAFHPEQRLAPWQAKRIVWNAWAPDPKVKLDLSNAMQMDSSPYSPLLGLSYGELAADSRSMHKSQGFGAAPAHGPTPENFMLLDGAPGRSLFEGIDVSWGRVPNSQTLAKQLKQATDEYKADKPSASIPVLLSALEEMRKLPDHPYKAKKLEELENVIAACAGVFVEAAASSFTVIPGGAVELTLTALVRADAPAIRLREIRLSDGQVLAADAAKATLKVAENARHSSPEWLREPPASVGTWSVAGPAQAIMPESPSELWADFVFERFTVRRAVTFKWTDPTAGERFRPVEVLPSVLVKPETAMLVFADAAAKTVKVVVTASTDGLTGQLRADAPKGWLVTPATAPFALSKRNARVELSFQVTAAKGSETGAALRFAAVVGEQPLGLGLTRIEYPHIPAQTLLMPAEVKLVKVSLAKQRIRRVGYIVGAGDDVPAALRQVGYEVTLLDDEALRSKPLTAWDAIVVGVRAYNIDPRLIEVRARLMKYVSDGGTLLVQYNTKNRLSDVPPDIGPYPFELSHERVTDENAAVTFEAKGVLSAPNQLSAVDFEGWVQERGLYFASTWDARYQAPLSMHDVGEPARHGGLLIAKHGKGTFIYTGLSFFRQLPAGVPGAYRLFANLLAHGR